MHLLYPGSGRRFDLEDGGVVALLQRDGTALFSTVMKVVVGGTVGQRGTVYAIEFAVLAVVVRPVASVAGRLVADGRLPDAFDRLRLPPREVASSPEHSPHVRLLLIDLW